MYLGLFFGGIVLGFSIAAPVGPIGVLCIRRTLAEGRTSGFISGLGAASADAIYGAVAAFGLAFITNLLVGQQFWLRLIGGIFLCYLGCRTFFSKTAGQPPITEGTKIGASGIRLWSAYGSTFFLTLTNPMTILSFAAIFAGLNLAAQAQDTAAAGLTVLGVFTGSALWWLTLSLGVGLLRSRFKPETMRWVNRLSGMIITVFGIAALYSALSGL